jgi:hypothetical protein
MAATTVVWTVLPKGIRSGRIHLSVYARPRLSDGATLADFDAWKVWPNTDVKFFVTLGDGAEVAAQPEGPARRPDLWQKLFPTTTPVDAPDAAGVQALAASVPKVRSAPTGAVRSFVKRQYQLAGAFFATNPPTSSGYYQPQEGRAEDNGLPFARLSLNRVALDPDEKAKIRQLIRTRLDSDGYFLGGELTDPDTQYTYSAAQVNFLLVEQFHARSRANNHAESGPAPKARVLAAPADQLDFHSVVGHLTAYPELLRLLGLVRDISIPLPADLPADPVAVQVRADWTGAGATNEYTATLCQIGPDRCVAAPGPDAPVSDGLLKLDDPIFQLVEIDADAIANKLIGFGRSVNHAYDNSSGRARNLPMPPPSTEATGLALHRTDKAKVLYQALGKAAGIQAKLGTKALAATTLHAEDVLRGYRLDVWDDETEEWHSLCLRSGSYTFDDVTIKINDEGLIESAHTEQSNDDTIYLHESMARWIGYSLVAPRPGKATAGDDDAELVGPDTEPDDRFTLKTSFTAAKGSLPKLRYGRTYRLRARTVDLAGNGRTLNEFDDDDFTAATDPVTYHRFEPVGAPNVLLRKPRTEGESPERMVIRGNYNVPTAGDSQRHLVPNKAAELTAEQHGMFDVPANLLNPSGMSKTAYSLIKERDPATLAGLGKPDPSGIDLRYYDTDQLKLPYLPDVLARGAAFADLPGSDGVVTVDFDFALLQKWPDARPFRVRLIEGTGAPQWNAGSRVLTVQLPRGRVAQVRYSCRVKADDLDLLGMWAWLKEYIESEGPVDHTLDELKVLATKGQLWLLTPYRTLELVHAIRQPLAPPAFTKPIASRKIADTTAKIIDKITIDHRSTSKIDLLAQWDEPVDSLTEPGPTTITGRDHAFELAIDSSEEAADVVPVGDVQEFHDTKHRRINYELVATTRYAEYFVERKQVTLIKGADTAISAKGIVPGSDVITSTGEPKVSYVRDHDYTVDYSAGTILPTDTFAGGAVEVAFVAPPVTRSSIEAKPAAIVDIPSSARPAIPEVAYLVPTFGWQTSTAGTTITSKRLGHGLRVFLHRPWYSSGDGEQLGVVLLRQAPSSDPTTRQQLFDRLGRFITTWGLDPVFATQSPAEPLPAVPLVTDFPKAVRPKTKIKLAESDADQTLDGQFVAVAPHDVHYDEQRRLWFADITLTASPAYTPFIRLALARYQPKSISTVELSPVALAQFAQLNPDRTLTVTGAATATQLTVTVAGGTGYTSVGSDYAKPPLVEALVQTKNPALTGDLAWKTVGDPIPLPAGTTPATWSGTVTLPGPRGSQPFRLVVREFEVPAKGAERRLVYTDAVPL